MSLLDHALCLLVGVLAVVSARAWWHHRMANHLRRLRKAETIRGAFADVRNQLFQHMMAGGISPKSQTFRALYFVTTSVMRRDDQYERLWPAFVKSIQEVERPRSEGGAAIASEAKNWDPTTAEIARRFVQAIELMLVEYSLLMWGILRIAGGILALRQAARHARVTEQPRQRESLARIEERLEVFETQHRPERAAVRNFQVMFRGPSAGSASAMA